MADDKDNKIDVASITKSVTEAVTKSLSDAFGAKIEDLAKNQKVIVDTMAADAKKIADAKKATDDAAAAATKPADAKVESPTPESIAKLVTDGVAAALKTRDDEAAKTTARTATIEKLTKEKLGGKADLAKLLTGGDEAALTAQADALAASLNLKPGVASSTKDGGLPPGAISSKPPVGVLSEGVAKYAESIKLPGMQPANA